VAERAGFAWRPLRGLRADKERSLSYQALLPVLNAKRIDLLDIPRLSSQLSSLERKTVAG
jgi:hypothetical protein